ncbi:MAG: hypothetical protein AAGI48_00485 [Verrucomicrobiota bacterium]
MSGKGYLPHSVVKAVVFWTLVVCIMTATTAGILRSWDVLGAEWAARWVTSSIILGCGSVTFLFVNCLFGELGAGLFSQSTPRPPIDPAFGERLKRAKVSSKAEQDSLAG